MEPQSVGDIYHSKTPDPIIHMQTFDENLEMKNNKNNNQNNEVEIVNPVDNNLNFHDKNDPDNGEHFHKQDDETNDDNSIQIDETRRSTLNRYSVVHLNPTLKGQRHEDITLSQHTHPDAHFHEIGYDLVHKCMDKLSMREVFLEYGVKASKSIDKELNQIHLRKTFSPIDPKFLSQEKMKKVLESHLLIELKRDGNIKNLLVDGGNKQRDFLHKYDVGSPTISTERIFLTELINAQELRDVETCDLPNAFVKTEIQVTVHMRLRGELVNKLMAIDPVYKQHVLFNKSSDPILYVELNKEFYGIMELGK